MGHQKVGLAPVVLPAHEGQSMNPETAAFEDLACLAAAKHIEQEQESEAIDRKMKPMTHALRDAVGAEALKNMTEEEKVEKFKALMCQGAGGAEDENGDTNIQPSEKSRAKALKIKAQS